MFGRHRKQAPKKNVVHTPECTAIHEAILMSLYLGYGSPAAPLFTPTGSLVCTCDHNDESGSTAPAAPSEKSTTSANHFGLLVSA